MCRKCVGNVSKMCRKCVMNVEFSNFTAFQLGTLRKTLIPQTFSSFFMVPHRFSPLKDCLRLNISDKKHVIFGQDLDLLNYLVVQSKLFIRVAELRPANLAEFFLYFSSTFLYPPGSVRKVLELSLCSPEVFKEKTVRV